MKRLGLSLITASLLVSSAIASESLVDALTTNAKVGGEARIMNVSGNNSSVQALLIQRDKNTTSGAIDLHYTTGSFYGFKFGIMGQAGYDFQTHTEDINDEDDFRNSVSDIGIARLWLQYAYSKSSITAGRIAIETPLLSVSDNYFPMKDAFDGANIKIGDIKDTHIEFSYVHKIVKRYGKDAYELGDAAGLPPGLDHAQVAAESDITMDDGLYSLYLKNNSHKPLLLEAQYIRVGDHQEEVVDFGDGPTSVVGAYDQWLLRFDYKLPIPYLFKIGMTYGQAHFDESQKLRENNRPALTPHNDAHLVDPNGDENASQFGVQLTTNVGPVLLRGSYTTVSDENMWPSTAGDFPCNTTYTNGMAMPTYFAGVEAYSLQALYRPVKNLGLMAKFIVAEQSKEGQAHTRRFRVMNQSFRQADQWNELFLAANWDMSFLLKGLSSRAMVSFTDFSDEYRASPFTGESSRSTYGRYWLFYKF